MRKGVLSVLTALTGAVVGAGAVGKATNKKINTTKSNAQRYLSLFQMMNQWVRVKQDGKNLSLYFQEHGYRKIAIYGMSVAGETLLNELKDTEITVAYGIDRRAESLYAEVDIVTIEEPLEDVDAVVVTAITFFDEIEQQLSEKVNCPIISLEDILYEV